MHRQLRPSGLRALSVVLPSEARTITMPSGDDARRYTLAAGETGMNLDQAAAEQALEAAGLEPADVDLVISASFPALPEPCIGNATPLAWEMGMEKAAAWNVEAACAGGLVALRHAFHEVMLGEYDTVLLVVGCPYSHTVESGHPAFDVVGDAAFAAVVGPTATGQEFLGSVVKNSGPTCPLVSWSVDLKVPSGIRLTVTGKTAGLIEDWALTQLPDLQAQLFERTGLAVADVDHWVCNAPTPGFVDRALATMGADPRDGVNINRLVNIDTPISAGPILPYNAHLRDFQPGDLVLCCSVGSESSLALTLFRWPENVALGPVPAHASLAQMREFESQRLAVAV